LRSLRASFVSVMLQTWEKLSRMPMAPACLRSIDVPPRSPTPWIVEESEAHKARGDYWMVVCIYRVCTVQCLPAHCCCMPVYHIFISYQAWALMLSEGPQLV
jgi:hypothetical protein